MKLTIDNLDGNGVVDYSSAVLAKPPLVITRKLNQPSLCAWTLVISGTNLVAPSRNGRVIVTDNSGLVLFTGYVADEPSRELAGASTEGAVYTLGVSAISDEFLLERQTVPQTRATAGQTAGQLVATLTGRVDPTRLLTSGVQAIGPLGHFMPDAGQSWSENAGAVASMARSAYYALSGGLNLAPVGTVTHALSEANGTLQVQALQASLVKTLANDVTVCGAEEPAAYVTEIFQGDGTTVLFDLTRLPFFPTASHSKPLIDLFQGPTINPTLWNVSDPGAHISLTSSGLAVSGGNGVDGQTVVAAIDPLEIGGTLAIEAGGVQIGAQSAGIFCGLYGGVVSTANCLAGFLIKQSGGATVLIPLVQGVAAGATYSPIAGHLYTLRIRTYCKEVQRVLASYYAVGDSGSTSFGGQSAPCPTNVVLEIQDVTNGVTNTSVVLYDGTIAAAAPLCTFAPVNSTNLVGSIKTVTVTEAGAVWVTSQDSGGTVFTRKQGVATQGADCRVERDGKLHFYATSVPASNELITVTYRTTRRAVARLASAQSIAAEGSTQIPGTSRWIGSVTQPLARSSADCENAALALLELAVSRAAAWSGKYVGYNMQATQDVWPGDVLAVDATPTGINANLVVREVRIEMPSASPDLTKYTIHFANDWATDLSMKLSSSVPKDAWLPQQAATSVTVLGNLLQLSITLGTGGVIQIAAGAAPPAGGGFEVRRRDWVFAPGSDSDLVLRSPVSNFSIPREAPIEQYFIRQYDGANPPNYSRFSSAVFINVPL